MAYYVQLWIAPRAILWKVDCSDKSTAAEAHIPARQNLWLAKPQMRERPDCRMCMLLDRKDCMQKVLT